MSAGASGLEGAAAAARLAWLVDGDDPTLVSNEVRRLVAELAGDSAALSVEDFWGDDVDLDAVTGACVTPPFLVDRRVVVLRDAGRFSTEELAPVLAYLDNPMPTTALVIAAGGGRLAAKLVAAVKKVGHVVATSPGRDSRSWVEAHLRQAPLRFDAGARAMVAEHLGEDLGRLPALLDALVAAYGEGQSIGVDELVPYLGQAGSVAPWEMTDAIDRGDAAAALSALHRLLEAGERHPLVVLSILHRHVAPMLTLDGSGATTEGQAAALLGIDKGRSTYPAKKALTALRRWGSDGVARAVHLIAEADLDLRGESTWPAQTVLEVLVARLSRIGRTSSQAARPSGRRSG
jgi:DNA polymerase-3 subunit delta